MRAAMLLVLTGCGLYHDGTFTCADDAQCGAGGKCTGAVCAFTDTGCASGYRYGAYSGPQSNQCTGKMTCADGQSPSVFEDFDGANPPCGPAGGTAMTGGMMMLDGGGVLQLQPTPASAMGGGYCTWDPYAPGGGVIVHMPKAMTASGNDSTTLALYARDNSAIAELQVRPTVGLDFDPGNGVPVVTPVNWGPAASWLRLTPADASHVVAAFGPDGTTWNDLGTITWATSTASVKLVVGSTYGAATTVDDITQIAGIYACP